ncbi:gustatory receptor 16 [Diachasma alloeum]|uniref:Gustatory receptor n=2 Tax=Diachasma alloeum TaxID=454923 RepID=A0A4E0S4J8_9HYME|nr:gustatory receptor 16 [Diachasma alloeum]
MQRQSAWAEQGVIDKYLFSDSCTVRLVVVIFKLLGLAPISVESPRSLRTSTQNSTQGLMFKRCVSGIVYTYILVVIVFAASIITVPLINSETLHSDGDLLETFEAVKGVFGLIVVLVIWLIVAFRYKKVLKILNKIVEMDNEMLMLQDLYYLETSKRRILVMFGGNSIMWVVIFVLEILSVPDWWKIWTPLLLPSFVMNWYIMQYILMLVMIENRFVSVNRGFIMISNSRIETFFHADVRPADVSERVIVNNFMTLRRAHAVLSGICRDISDYYSFPILPTVTFFCGASIYHSYYIIVPLVAKTRQRSILESTNMVCWLMMQVLPVVVLSVCVTRVLNQMGMTGGTVYKVIARSILNYVAKDELKKFSFELLHKNVQFTAYDIFSLDCTLIQSIFGMLATYLIILMQFQLSHTSQRDYKYATSSPETSSQ